MNWIQIIHLRERFVNLFSKQQDVCFILWGQSESASSRRRYRLERPGSSHLLFISLLFINAILGPRELQISVSNRAKCKLSHHMNRGYKSVVKQDRLATRRMYSVLLKLMNAKQDLADRPQARILLYKLINDSINICPRSLARPSSNLMNKARWCLKYSNSPRQFWNKANSLTPTNRPTVLSIDQYTMHDRSRKQSIIDSVGKGTSLLQKNEWLSSHVAIRRAYEWGRYFNELCSWKKQRERLNYASFA